MYLRAVRTYKSVMQCISEKYKSVVMYSGISEYKSCMSHASLSIQNLQVSGYVLMHLRALRTNKSVVMYSCISEQSELTSHYTHVSQSIPNLQVSSYVLMYL